MDGARDGGSVECAETPLFFIKGFGFPLPFIYSPIVIKENMAGYSSRRKRLGEVREERRRRRRRKGAQEEMEKVK